jgi:hypothetical protein
MKIRRFILTRVQSSEVVFKRAASLGTWGRKQQMTWAFFDKYCDEAYAIVVDKDSAKSKLDVQKLVDALNSLK